MDSTTLKSRLETWLLWRKDFFGSLARRVWEWRKITIDGISDEVALWRAINKKEQINPKTGKLKPSFFSERKGLSCELAPFTRAESARLGIPPRWPNESGLAEFDVGSVRSVHGDVVHDPVSQPDNKSYAHSVVVSLGISRLDLKRDDVDAKLQTGDRTKLAELSRIVIRPTFPVG